MKLGLILGLTLCLFTAALLAPVIHLSSSLALAGAGEDEGPDQGDGTSSDGGSD